MRRSARNAWGGRAAAARLAVLLLVCAALSGCAQAPRVLYEGRSPYNAILITEDAKGLRTLLFEHGGGRQSVVDPQDATRLELPYLRAALIGLALCAEPRRLLVVGLGGGTLARYLHHHYPEAAVDVVDIDPGVVEAARAYFGFLEDANLRVHVADGRSYIERVTTPYDAIFLDAFDARNVPLHMTTVEFLSAVRRAVRPDGVVVGNIWNSANNPLYASMVRTYRAVFDAVRIVPVLSDVNHVLLALPRPAPPERELAQRIARIAADKGFGFDPGAALAAPLPDEEALISSAPVLQDDRPAPGRGPPPRL